MTFQSNTVKQSWCEFESYVLSFRLSLQKQTLLGHWCCVSLHCRWPWGPWLLIHPSRQEHKPAKDRCDAAPGPDRGLELNYRPPVRSSHKTDSLQLSLRWNKIHSSTCLVLSKPVLFQKCNFSFFSIKLTKPEPMKKQISLNQVYQ